MYYINIYIILLNNNNNSNIKLTFISTILITCSLVYSISLRRRSES